MADLVPSSNPFMDLFQELSMSPAQRFMRLLNPQVGGMSTPQPYTMPAVAPTAPAAPASAEDSFMPIIREAMAKAQNYGKPTVSALGEDDKRLALMRLGAGLMQPRGVGQTYAGIAGQAISGYGESLEKARREEEARMLQKMLLPAELATKGASIGASEASTARTKGVEARERALFPTQQRTADLNLERATQGLEKDKIELQQLQARAALLTPTELKRMHDLEIRVKEANIAQSNAAAGASAATARAANARAKLAEEGNMNIDAYIEVALDEMNLDSNDRTKPANRAKARVRANQMMEEDSRRGLYGPQNSAEAAIYRANLTAAINGLKAQLENLPLGNKPEVVAARERINAELADLTSRLTQSLLQGGGVAKPGAATSATGAPAAKRYKYTDILSEPAAGD